MAALALGAAASPLAAQGLRVTGRVVHLRGPDSLPVAGREVILHRVTPAAAGPVDSGRTDHRGRYVLRDTSPDSMASYVVSVEHDGIAYFGEPVRAPGGAVDARPLIVYDTSSTDPLVHLRERHVVIRTAEETGARRVIELLVLENRGRRTRVAPDTSRPVWTGALPPQAIQFEVGESDVSGDAVYRRGARVAVAAPIPPGQRQILVSYLLPSGTRHVALPLDHPVDHLNLLLEDGEAVLEGPLALQGLEELDQLAFRRFYAADVPAGTPVAVQFASAPWDVADFWWLLVPLATLVLAVAFVLWWRRAGGALPAPVAAAPEDPEVLAARIAALDAEFEGREDDADYRARRGDLKARLARTLSGKEAPTRSPEGPGEHQ